MWVLGRLGVDPVVQAGKDPLSFSVALALKALRQAAHSPASDCRGLAAQLAAALEDSIRGTAPRTRGTGPVASVQTAGKAQTAAGHPGGN